MEVPVTAEDYALWIGRLYVERCQWEKAANMAHARALTLEAQSLTSPPPAPAEPEAAG